MGAWKEGKASYVRSKELWVGSTNTEELCLKLIDSPYLLFSLHEIHVKEHDGSEQNLEIPNEW